MLGRLTLLLFGIIGGLLMAEGAVRVLGLAPQLAPITVTVAKSDYEPIVHPILRYVPRPASSDINTFGIRDYEFGKTPPASGIRIILLGDSVGFGWCMQPGPLPVADTIPKITERLINEGSAEAVQLLNFSVSGYNAEEEVAFFELKGRDLKPDMVVVLNSYNDDTDASMELDSLLSNPEWKTYEALRSSVLPFIIKRSELARLVLLRLAKKPEEKTARKQGYLQPAYARLAEIAKEDRFKVLVARMPRLDSMEQDSLPGDAAKICGLVNQMNMPCRDLFPVLSAHFGKDAERSRCEKVDGVHPSVEANGVIAKYLADEIRKIL